MTSSRVCYRLAAITRRNGKLDMACLEAIVKEAPDFREVRVARATVYRA